MRGLNRAMLDKLFSGHLNTLQKGLNRATERQGLLTTNIANVNVPGYKRKDIDFSVALDGAIGKSPGDNRDFFADNFASSQGESSIRVDGNNVDMEHEVMSLAETELRFQAISDMTANYFGGLKNVIREGR